MLLPWSIAVAAKSISTTATNHSSSSIASEFFILTREQGVVRDDLPAWASKINNPFQLYTPVATTLVDDTTTTTTTCTSNRSLEQQESSNNTPPTVKRVEVDGVPGAFQILSILSKEEAKAMVDTFEELGFTDDAAVSLPKRIRHNSNLVWIADNTTLDILWDRTRDYFWESREGDFFGQTPIGLNGRFRVYRYEVNDYFKHHTDGSWPGTRVFKTKTGNNDDVHYELVQNAFPRRVWSMYSILFFLTDDFEGGETEFLVDPVDPAQTKRDEVDSAKTFGTRTPVGGVLCFPHGEHRLHCVHSSTPIIRGVKYIIRSDVLFEKVPKSNN